MKSLALLFALMGCALISWAQPDTLWTRVYGGTGSELIFSTRLAPDSNYIICGSTTSFGALGKDPYVLDVSPAGDMFLERWYQIDGEQQAGDARKLLDGSYIMVITDSILQSISLLRLLENGDINWARSYAVYQDWAAPLNVVQTADSGFLISGTKFTNGNHTDGYRLKTESDGDSVWLEEEGLDGWTDGRGGIKSTDVLADGNILLTGWMRSVYIDPRGPWCYVGAHIEEICDANGILISQYIHWMGCNGGGALRNPFLDGQGYWTQINAGLPLAPNPPPSHNLIYHYSNGSYLTLLCLSDLYCNAAGVSCICVLPPMECIAARNVLRDSTSGRDIQLVRYQSVGYTSRVIWEQWFGGELDQVVSNMFLTADSSVMLFGQTEHSQGQETDIYAIRTGVINLGVSFSRTNLLVATMALTSSPNPFNPTTTISFSIPKSEHVHLTAFDLNGREVATLVDERMEQGNHTRVFDGADLPSGIYFAHLTAGTTTLTQKMLLVK